MVKRNIMPSPTVESEDEDVEEGEEEDESDALQSKSRGLKSLLNSTALTLSTNAQH